MFFLFLFLYYYKNYKNILHIIKSGVKQVVLQLGLSKFINKPETIF